MEWPNVPKGVIGTICLGIYLLLVGVAALFQGLAIPPWVAASFACAAGLFILIGR